MRRDYRVNARLEAEDAASGTVKKVEGRFKRLGATAKTLKANWLALAAGAAGLVAALKAIVSASAEQEQALKRLSVAAERFGEQSAAVVAAATEQAAALQGISKFGDEAIITQQALLVQMGVSAEKLPLATQATVDLAEAMGIELESAARNIGKTMGGFAGELGELIPELKTLSAEQLKAGAGIDLLAGKFAGTAEKTQTFSKQISQLGNTFSDLLEALGDSVTQSEGATEGLETIRKAIEGLIPLARRMGDAFSILGDVVWNLALPLRGLAKITESLTDAWLSLSGATEVVEGRTEALEATAKRMGVTVGELKEHLDKATHGAENVNLALQKTGPAATAAGDGVETLTESLEGLAGAYGKAVDGTKALGIATSVQLEAQIIAISQELYNQKLILGEYSAEYEKLESIAAAKIEGLKTRIESLRDGLGDLQSTTEDSTTAIENYTRAMEDAAGATERETEATRSNTRAKEEQRREADRVTALFPGLSGKSYSYTVPGAAGGTYVSGGGKQARLAADGRIVF